MSKDQITFNDLPQVIAELGDEVSGMKALLLNLQNRPTQQRENRHRPVTPEQVAEYTNIPLANPIPLTDEEQNAAILASHKRKPKKADRQTDPIVESSRKVNVANATTSKPKAIAETDITPPTADAANDTDISNEYKDSNESTHSTASNSTVAFGDFNANDATSSFDRLKVIYKKVGNNESQAFGVWQQLSESERTAAFAHTQRLQGDLCLRSYLYVYLRDKEWMKAM